MRSSIGISLPDAFAVTCLFAVARCGSHDFDDGDASTDGATSDTPQLQDVVFNPQDGTNCGSTPPTSSSARPAAAATISRTTRA